jgi:TonB family protein
MRARVWIGTVAALVAASCASQPSRAPATADQPIPYSRAFAPAPNYPEAAMQQRIEGKVTAWLHVEADTTVSKVEIKQSPHELLSQEAIATFSRWRVHPPLKDGKPVPFIAEYDINFDLSDPGNTKQALANERLLQRVAGIWGTVIDGKLSCDRAVETITFSPDRSTATFRSTSNYVVANGKRTDTLTSRILGIRDNRITMAYPDEHRNTDAGVPVVWTLILRGEDEFVWHRTDWPPGSTTAPRRRCKAG